MLGWLFRILLIAGGFVATWFVGRTAPNFGVAQGIAAMLLVVAAIAILAFWPFRLSGKPHGDQQRDKTI